MGRDASIQNKLQFYHLSEEKFNFATYSATYFIYFAHKAVKNPRFIRVLMVGTTGIEPVTPAMSMQGQVLLSVKDVIAVTRILPL
jgi:hypothetical protein